MILITGSTGTISSALIEELATLQAPTRALVHTPEKVSTVGREGVEAAERAGVRHVVKLSAFIADPGSSLRFGRTHGEGEQHLQESDLSWTFLRPNSFMQNTLANAWSIASEGRLYSPILDAKVALIDARDVAAVAARVLTEEGHGSKTYELTGPEAISNREAAEQLSTVLERPLECVKAPFEDARRAMVGGGMPEWLADGVIELAQLQETGYAANLTNGVAEVTGHEPRRFDEFARDYKSAFLGDSSTKS